MFIRITTQTVDPCWHRFERLRSPSFEKQPQPERDQRCNCVGDTYARDGEPSHLQTPALLLNLHRHELLAARPKARPARALVRRREHRHRTHFEVALARTHVLQVPQPIRRRLARARIPVDPDDDKQEHQALRIRGVSISFPGEGEGEGLLGTERATYDDRGKEAVADRKADVGAEEGGDAERDGRDGVDCGGLDDGLHDAPPHALRLRAVAGDPGVLRGGP